MIFLIVLTLNTTMQKRYNVSSKTWMGLQDKHYSINIKESPITKHIKRKESLKTCSSYFGGDDIEPGGYVVSTSNSLDKDEINNKSIVSSFD